MFEKSAKYEIPSARAVYLKSFIILIFFCEIKNIYPYKKLLNFLSFNKFINFKDFIKIHSLTRF